MPDNFRFDISGGGVLKDALAIAFSYTQSAKGYRIDVREGHPTRLVFYGYDSPKMLPFPAPLGSEETESIIKTWLKLLDYGSEPDIDGSVSKGFRVYNEDWGHVAREWQAFMAVEPAWLLHGK